MERGRTLAIVGESGCGKSTTVQAIMGLIDMPPGRITGGSARLLGQELIGLGARAINRVRGAAIGMIFQDPMTSLNPTMKIGSQIAETLIAHRGMARREALAQAVQLLDRMLQRVMIAISLACKPALLIADEPSTALDVTIQNQVLELMREIQREEGMAIVLITHDLGVVARMADDVAVMYAGRIVESGPVEDIFYRSAHPYTTGLKRAMPGAARTHRKLVAIAGSPPDLFAVPPGCAYAPRCPHAMNICAVHDPAPSALGAQHRASCWLHHPQAPAVATTPPTMSDTR